MNEVGLNNIYYSEVFIVWELIRNNEEMYMIIYCIIILWINLDYLKDYRQLKTSLSDVSSDDDELIINPDTIFVMFFVLIFNFFRRWLFYILAVLFTQNISFDFVPNDS